MAKAKRGFKQIQPRSAELQPYLEKLPWDKWKTEYVTRKNADGTWFYRNLRHFATQMVETGQVGNGKVKVTAQQFYLIVEYKCGPFALLGNTAYKDATTYHSDWNEARTGYRWGVENRTAATDLAKMDRQIYLMERVEYPLSKYRILIERALQMMKDIDGHFQGKILLDEPTYQSVMAPRLYRGKGKEADKNEKERVVREEAAYRLVLAQNAAQQNRYKIYCSMMERAQQMFEMACAGYRKCLQVGIPRITVQQAAIATSAPPLATEGGAPERNYLDRLAGTFLKGALDMAHNFEMEPPRFVDVVAESVEPDKAKSNGDKETVEIGKS